VCRQEKHTPKQTERREPTINKRQWESRQYVRFIKIVAIFCCILMTESRHLTSKQTIIHFLTSIFFFSFFKFCTNRVHTQLLLLYLHFLFFFVRYRVLLLGDPGNVCCFLKTKLLKQITILNFLFVFICAEFGYVLTFHILILLVYVIFVVVIVCVCVCVYVCVCWGFGIDV
jgi:hypothetical protein